MYIIMEIRKNIDILSDEQIRRFSLGWIRMNTNIKGEESSLLFNIAKLHGYPKNHCAHGVPQFLYWHRLYLLEFEKRLQFADKQNGYDGNIKLPYWNWIENKKIPNICNCFDFIPKKLLKKEIKMERRNSNDITEFLNVLNLKKNIENLMNQTRIDRFFLNQNDIVLENIHDDIHIALGYPMNSVEYAAYTLEFWLHHCFIDLILESYIKSKQKIGINVFSEYKKIARKKRIFRKPFFPFKKRNTIHKYHDQIKKSEYDKLIKIKNQRLIQKPIQCIISNLKATDFQNNSYLITCFCFENEEEMINFKEDSDFNTLIKDKHFAGIRTIFNMRKSECKNCQEREIFNLHINITECLRKLKISQHDTFIKIIVFDQNYTLTKNSYFNDFYIKGNIIDEGNIDYHPGDSCNQIKIIQEYLNKIGFYKGQINGILEKETIDSIKKLNDYFNINCDVINYQTKCILNKKRYDYSQDTYLNKIKISKNKFIFSVHNIPELYDENKVLNIVKISILFWSQITNIDYEIVDNIKSSNVKILFYELDGKNEILGERKNNVIILDEKENWNLTLNYYEESYSLLNVITHEIGHLLGFHHINNNKCIMYPYYENIDIFDKENISFLSNLI